jgi:hypothetical protein
MITDMKKWIILAGFTFLLSPSEAQFAREDAWPVLRQVTYEIKKHEKYGMLMYPQFTEDIKKLEGQWITLPGYVYPTQVHGKRDYIILSALPLQSCFFCGAGGPETVVQAYTKEKIGNYTNMIKIKGRLKLNATDPEVMMYILEETEFAGFVDF